MGQLRFVEMLLDRLVDDVRDTAIGDQRDGFGPLECSALARGLQQRLAPGVQEIDARLGLAARTGIAGMKMDAVGSSIDLRCTNPDELDQGRLESTKPGPEPPRPEIVRIARRPRARAGHRSIFTRRPTVPSRPPEDPVHICR